ncbi:MAG TPA: hypothetical protein VLW50_18590 [Streptosporangiaceae bacterium]|nr:hypothetical protein [Streptosporangiaceae bacterium]
MHPRPWRCPGKRQAGSAPAPTRSGVGTGFGEAALASLTKTLSGLERPQPPLDRGTLRRNGVHWVEPRLAGQVAFSEWTSAGQLRHQRFQGLRRDKDPASVIRETA